MGIEMNVTKVVPVKAKTVRLFAKLCDEGSYTLYDEQGDVIAERDEDYVPNKVIPGQHGDYVDLMIDLETGRIENWKVPTGADLAEAFGVSSEDD